MKSTTKNIRKVIEKKRKHAREWSGAGKCPICSKAFKSDLCAHSYGQAQDRMVDDLIVSAIRTIVKEEVSKQLKEVNAPIV